MIKSLQLNKVLEEYNEFTQKGEERNQKAGGGFSLGSSFSFDINNANASNMLSKVIAMDRR